MIFLEENLGEKSLLDIGLGMISRKSQYNHKQRGENKQVGLHQTKNLLHSKESINKVKGQPTKWKK